MHATWNDLNAAVRIAGETDCVALLKEELKGRKRKMFLLRIHSRLNRVRADRERGELAQVISDKVKPQSLKWLK